MCTVRLDIGNLDRFTVLRIVHGKCLNYYAYSEKIQGSTKIKHSRPTNNPNGAKLRVALITLKLHIFSVI